MKKIFYSLLTPVLLLTACGDDDEDKPDTHEIGDWTLENYVMTNLPTAFSDYEDQSLKLSDVIIGGVEVETYDLTFTNKKTYSRRIDVKDKPNINDDGTWELDDDSLTLTNADDEEDVYTIEKNSSDQLWWSTEVKFNLYSNATLKEYKVEEREDFTNEQKEALLESVSVDLVYAFERK